MTSKFFPLVTIAIPTFNRADSYLRSALCCATEQTYPNLEIIVSDNCSSDNTAELVEAFKDPRVLYFRHHENIGANNNFNFCLGRARGEHFLLLQDDDLVDRDFIETCIRGADGNEAGIIRTGTRVIDSAGDVLWERQNLVEGLSNEEFFLGWFSGKTVLYLCSTLFNTNLLRAIGGFGSKHNLFQDVVAEVELASRFGRVDIRDVKASFRKHGGEMTFSAHIGNWCEDSLILLDQMCSFSAKERRGVIRKEGMKFLARINYSRALAVRSPFKRFLAYATVCRMFHYRYLPPVKHFVRPLYAPLQGTRIDFALRSIKRHICGSFTRGSV